MLALAPACDLTQWNSPCAAAERQLKTVSATVSALQVCKVVCALLVIESVLPMLFEIRIDPRPVVTNASVCDQALDLAG